MPLIIPNQSSQTCGSPEVVTSSTSLRNVMENQTGKAGTPHPENSNWATLLRKDQEFPLLWPNKVGSCQRNPPAIGLKLVSLN